VAGIHTSNSWLDPLAAVRLRAEAGANQRGASFLDSGLRLFDSSGFDVGVLTEQVHGSATGDPVSAFSLGRTYELALAPESRRKTGSHLTPEQIARNLVAMMAPAQPDDRVLDPSVGGAAFLLAAADQLVAAGATPHDVPSQLYGFDIDPGAVAVAEAAVALWALDHGGNPGPLPGLRLADGLLDELPNVERIVGNPPFLNQLRAASSHTSDRRDALRDRWGDIVATYTDDAWLFLAAGLGALTKRGSLAMVQPVSILAARDGHAVRARVHEDARLSALWVGRDRVFDAAVQVCGIVLERGRGASGPVRRVVGAEFDPIDALEEQPGPMGWGSAAAATLDVPTVHLAPSPKTVGDLATATAGFRDQFYGFVPYVADSPSKRVAKNRAKLVTVGMIDVLSLRWGTRSFKFAKQDFVRPVVDLTALRENDPSLAKWADDRLRPKLMMATQTRVVELWVDADGSCIPATPVLSIEPHEPSDLESIWLLAAALSAPALSASLVAAKFGTAMSITALKLAARDVLAVPLPSQQRPWREAAELLRSNPAEFGEFAALMGAAYQSEGAGLIDWWLDRVPKRPR